MRSRISSGYSMVELLVVLGIIVLLAGIIVATVARAREMGRQSVCLSNIRQLTFAWITYAGENKGRLCNSVGNPEWLLFDPKVSNKIRYTPVADDPDSIIPNGQLWPFLRERRVYLCPSDPQQYRNISVAPPAIWVRGQTGTSYSMNLAMGYPFPPSTADPLLPTMMGQIRNPGSRMVFFEGNDGWLLDPGSGWYCEINSWHASSSGSFGRIAVSFADGHAVHWMLAGWGAEQRRWVLIDEIDDRQFHAWMTGIFPPGVMQ